MIHAVYTKGSVFKATCTHHHHRKTIEPPKDQPVLSPSEESSSSPETSLSSASREVVLQKSSVTATTENDRGKMENPHPLLFSTHTEDQTSLATDQPIPAVHEFKKEEKGIAAIVLLLAIRDNNMIQNYFLLLRVQL